MMYRTPWLVICFFLSLLPGVPGWAEGGREDEAVESFRADANCAQCHVLISLEWRTSRHAGAGTTEALELLRALGEETYERLLPYYQPTAVLAGAGSEAPPSARSRFPERGVDCIACHMDRQFRMHGTNGFSAPHKVVRDRQLSGVGACMSCHGQGDELDQVSAWQQAGHDDTRVSCQSCHMPDVRRQSVQHWTMRELPERNGHDHFFPGATDLERLKGAVTLEAELSAQAVVVRLICGMIGHTFPGIGFRQAVLTAEGLADGGSLLWKRQELIDQIIHDNRLRPGETREFSYPAAGASEVRVRLVYRRAPGRQKDSVVIQDFTAKTQRREARNR